MKEIYLTKGLVRYNGKYLLLKKQKDMIEENIGKWEVPGGRIEKDENPKDTLLREILEETGLRCRIIKELPLLEMTSGEYHSRCHVFLAESDSEKVILSEEHSDFVWKLPEEVKDMPLVLFADLLLEYLDHAEKYLDE